MKEKIMKSNWTAWSWLFLAALVFFLFFGATVQYSCAGEVSLVQAGMAADAVDDDPSFADEQLLELADPLEPLNRLFYTFNDRLYFWAVKPVATGYAKLLAEEIRICINNAFTNLMTPVRVVNSLLQGKVHGAGVELARFVVNTFAGVGGLGDPASSEFNLLPSDEDFGQTLGVYGLGDVLYLHWPLFGPSSIRDTIGLAGDFALNPLTYILADSGGVGTAIQVGRRINSTSLHLGDYELFKKTSLDPYSAMRNAYHQYRHGKIKDLSNQQDNTDFSYRAPAPAEEQPRRVAVRK